MWKLDELLISDAHSRTTVTGSEGNSSMPMTKNLVFLQVTAQKVRIIVLFLEGHLNQSYSDKSCTLLSGEKNYKNTTFDKKARLCTVKLCGLC